MNNMNTVMSGIMSRSSLDLRRISSEHVFLTLAASSQSSVRNELFVSR